MQEEYEIELTNGELELEQEVHNLQHKITETDSSIQDVEDEIPGEKEKEEKNFLLKGHN